MLGYEYLKTKTPHPPFDVIVLQLEPADEVMEDSNRGECLTLCPLKDLGVVEMKPVCEEGRGQRKQCRGLNFLSKGKREALAGQGILFTNATL